MATVAAQVIVGALVSKVATEVVSSVAQGVFKMNPKDANLLGGIAGIAAGIYAGGQVGNAANGANTAKGASDAANAGDALAGAEGATAPPLASPEAITSTPLPEVPQSPIVKPVSTPSVSNLAQSGTVAGASPAAAAPPPSVADYSLAGADSGLAGGAETFAPLSDVAPGANAAITGGTVPPPEAPWYKTMWDNKTVQQMAGGAAMGSANAMLQANALEAQAKQQRQQQIDDRQYYRDSWKNLDAPRVNPLMMNNAPQQKPFRPQPYQPQSYTPQPYTPMPVMRRRG